MRHILTVERDDGTFADAGGSSRWVITAAARATAVRIATESSAKYRRRVRVESYADHEFYKSDAFPLTTVVGKSVLSLEKAAD